VRWPEARICLGKDFSFRNCAEIARCTCRMDKVAMPDARRMKAQ
jgi:hypothetical protein